MTSRGPASLVVFALLVAACSSGDSAGPPTTPMPPTTEQRQETPPPNTDNPPSPPTTSSSPTVIPPSPIAPDPDFVLRYAVPGPVDMRSNPFASRDRGEFPEEFAAHMYRVLPPALTLIPQLAADDEPPPTEFDGTGWVATVELNRGLTWSDGDPIDAFDVQFTFEDLVAFGDPDEHGWIIEDPRGTADLVAVEAIDDYTVAVKFSARPTIDRWDYGVATASILPEHYWGFTFATLAEGNQQDPGLGMDAPSAGGYRFGEPGSDDEWEWIAVTDWWNSGARYLIHENGAVSYDNARLGISETYGGSASLESPGGWTEGPFAGSVLWRDFGDLNAAVFAVSQGRADLVRDGVRVELAPTPSSSVPEELRVRGSDGLLRSVVFNPETALFASQALRVAVTCFIQASFLIDSVLQGRAVAAGWVPDVARAWTGTAESGDPCPGSGPERAATGLDLMTRLGWMWGSEEDGTTEPVIGVLGGEVQIETESLFHPDGTPTSVTLLAPHESIDDMAATTSLWVEGWLEQVGFDVLVIRPSPGDPEPPEWDIAIGRDAFVIPPTPLLHPSADFEFEHLAVASSLAAPEIWGRMEAALRAEALAMPLFTVPFDNAVGAAVLLPYETTAGGLDAGWLATAIQASRDG